MQVLFIICQTIEINIPQYSKLHRFKRTRFVQRFPIFFYLMASPRRVLRTTVAKHVHQSTPSSHCLVRYRQNAAEPMWTSTSAFLIFSIVIGINSSTSRCLHHSVVDCGIRFEGSSSILQSYSSHSLSIILGFFTLGTLFYHQQIFNRGVAIIERLVLNLDSIVT